MPSPDRAISPERGSQTWLAGRRGLIIAAVATAAAIAVALGQPWLSTAALLQPLFILPCAAVMFMCMKGSGHGQPTNSLPVSAQGRAPEADLRN